MNFSVYVNKELAEKITQLSKSLKRTRNSIINEALEEWLKKQKGRHWPEHFFDFKPLLDVPDFTELRKIKAPNKDPLS